MDKAQLGIACLGWACNGVHKHIEGFEDGPGFIRGGALQKQLYNDFIAQAMFYGAEFCRIFPYETKFVTKWQDMFSPYLWDEAKKAWNLDTHNEAYFEALDYMVATAVVLQEI